MINASPFNVALARAALVAQLLPEDMNMREQDAVTYALEQWVHAAGTEHESDARQSIVNLAIAMVRARGGCACGALAELVAYMLHILFPEDEPAGDREHWRDSDGCTWDEAAMPANFRTTLHELRQMVDAGGF
jgi:hypothetical protein